jgi:phosphotransferase system HPr (HPr) family protein
MIRKNLTIREDDGLQPGAAELLVHVAGGFSADIWIQHGNKRVNAKSIMGVLSLRLRRGDCFLVAASGSDEERAVAAIARLVEKGEA